MIASDVTYEIDESKPSVPFIGRGHCESCGREDEVYTPDGLARMGIEPGITRLFCDVCERVGFIIDP